MTKVLFFVDVGWVSGAIHFDLTRYLHARGVISDVLDWGRSYGHQEMTMLAEYYDYVVTAPGQTGALTDSYLIPHAKIIIVAHSFYDLRALRTRPPEELDRFAGYGVVSDVLLQLSVSLGISRLPSVLRPGINYQKYYTPVSSALEAVGYASTFHQDNGARLDIKRGFLARQVAEAAGLPFKPASGYTFMAMPAYYAEVGAVLTTSLTESVGLPAMEAAAAGRLVIGTPAGRLPFLVSIGAATLAPFDASDYRDFVAAKLRYFRKNPAAYMDTCTAAQEAARQLDWEHCLGDWVAFLSKPR